MFIQMELYRAFYTVAKEGSISKASELLFITQPAVSRAIRQLEEKSGCTLFFRTSRGVSLTKEGEILFQYIEQAFNFIQQGEKKLSELKNLEKGEISIGASDTICRHYLLPYLNDFNLSYPGIRIHMTNHTTPYNISLLKKGAIDLGIVNLPVVDDQLVVHNIMEIQDCFVVGEKYRSLAMKPRSIEEIVEYPMLMLQKESNSRLYIDKYLASHRISIKPEIELSTLEMLAQFAMINFGVACVIKNFITYELVKSFLYEIELKEPIPPRNIGIIYLKNVPLSTAASKFLKLLVTDKKS